ncbi:uncharacterized protein NECHADRAFT_77550 [Fusarium vanettenii 77-13-4]|uniref:Uncharacterized protein n=1 Tax=Fusarium vanettenii (strain ATCC MYA-4622 / CBS 123669 / FGSC 9596 / NRRL 45880 / 77-13-4) TaxID=660122 RepID=C7YLI9_FUSV7|nr:uncharacterized protein NECHADRAFT_77550 [Fusarium vanettenii 77-13-4]EEU47272.1 predicted protein [Fusarium vanettenii 77-13-4]
MCWKVIIHNLRCDVRPLIYDGMYGKYIDSFQTPTPCKCAAKHQARVQCQDHGCCFLTEYIEACSHKNCTQTYDIHRYKHLPQQQKVWMINPIFYTQPGDDWEPIQYVDVAIFSRDLPPQYIDWADEFKDEFTNLVLKGREINKKHAELTQIHAEIDSERKLHAAQHSILCKGTGVICPLKQKLKAAEQTAANLRSEGLTLSVEFKRLWADVNNRVVRYMVMEQVNEILRLRGVT